ncbi:MAG: PIN domain-containing protein [Candidatus Lokiarchaeota archaeon]|nr:PIN domain-containing protein [Candidatus Lokiarchaeota archaeon]
MVLVDTSVWISHLRLGEPRLQNLLHKTRVCCHPVIINELACGTLKNRNQILSLLQALPHVNTISHEELLILIERHQFMGKGLGYVDISLLGSALISDCLLWTMDKALRQAAIELGVEYE